jgi:pimeloyl-ACP methyl ester carboxylesterase
MNPSRGPGGMFVHESGTPGAPAILFLHGVGQSGREWREHMARLSGFHGLAPDLPGHGRSNHLPLPSNERIVDLIAELIEARVPAGRAHIVDEADLRVASRRAFWKVWAVALAHLTAATEAPCPTLLVAGEKEGFVRPGNAALAQLMPHAGARFAPGLDHCWQRKDPGLHIRMV